MDLVIAYDRIQILLPKVKRFGDLRINTLVMIGLAFTILTNIPVNIGRSVVKILLRTQFNNTIVLLVNGNSYFLNFELIKL